MKDDPLSRPSPSSYPLIFLMLCSIAAIIADNNLNMNKIKPDSTATLGSHVTSSRVESFVATLASFLQTQFSKQNALTLPRIQNFPGLTPLKMRKHL